MTAPGDLVYGYRYDSKNRLDQVTYPDQTTRQYHYEKTSMPYGLTGITDQRGIRYITYDYNASDLGSSISYGNQQKNSTISYSSSGNTVTNSRAVKTVYTLAEQLQTPLVSGITGPSCTSCGGGGGGNEQRQYDSANNLISLTQDGTTTTYGNYDANRNPGYRIDAVETPQERRLDFEYDAQFRGLASKIREPSVSMGQHKETRLTYDDDGQLTELTIAGFTPAGTAVSRTVSYQYQGPLKQLSQMDGPRTDVVDVINFSYYPDAASAGDNRARLQQVTAGSLVLLDNLQYTATGQLRQETRPNGVTASYSYYPGNDRLQSLTVSQGTQSRITQWSYLPTGEVASITAGQGTAAAVLLFEYDEARRLQKIKDGQGNSKVYTLDTEGNPQQVAIYDPNQVLSRTLKQSFDDYNHLDQLTQSHGNKNYDILANGLLSQWQDGNTVVTQMSYDGLKRLAQTTQDPTGLNLQSRYDYDGQDHLTQVTDPKGNATQYTYDDLGNLLATTSPDTGLSQWGYDAAGNITGRTDAKGITLQYRYDALNRLIVVDAPGSDADLAYHYDSSLNGLGRLASLVHAQGRTEWDYTPFGEVAEKREIVGTLTLRSQYGYNSAGQLHQLTYPSGLVVEAIYQNGMVTELQANGQALLTEIQHAPLGEVTQWRGLNNSLVQRKHGDSSLLNTVTLGTDTRILGYDAVGNVQQLSDARQTLDFAYDVIDRLTGMTGGVAALGYHYDANSNRTQLVVGNTPYLYDNDPASNRLLQAEGPILKTYQHDANGHITQDGLHTYTYNANQRLVTVDAVNYYHNGLGQRILKSSGGGGALTLLNETFTGIDGKVIDDQTNGLWLGGPSKFGASATIQGNQALIKPKKAIYAVPPLTDSGSPLTVSVVLDRGTLQLQGTTKKANLITAAYNGQQQVVLKVGSKWLASKRIEKTLVLPQGGGPITLQLTLTAGIAQLKITDQGQTVDSGPLNSKALALGDNYQLQLLATAVNGTQTLDSRADTVVVTTAGGGNAGTSFAYHETGQLLGEYGANGQALQETVYLGDIPVAVAKQGTLYPIYADHLGTPRVITDASQREIWRWEENEPFGNSLANADPDGDGVKFEYNLRFPGQYFDVETGLHYNYFRDYDPSTGRYMQSDPIGLAGGLNTYGYVGGNPITYFDLFGLGKSRHERPSSEFADWTDKQVSDCARGKGPDGQPVSTELRQKCKTEDKVRGQRNKKKRENLTLSGYHMIFFH